MKEKELREYQRRIKKAKQDLLLYRMQLESDTRKGLARIDKCLADIAIWQAVIEENERS